MKVKILFAFIICASLLACNSNRKNSTTDIDVARAFIKDILENDFKDAKTLVLNEEMNNQYFDLSKKDFEGKSQEDLEKYKKADIIINEIKSVNDSVTVVNYSNSFKTGIKNEVMVVRVNGQWLVDLKHTFQEGHN